MTVQRIEGEDAVIFLQGLRQNVTISALSLNISLLSDLSLCGDILVDYLRHNRTLRCLTIREGFRVWFDDLDAIIGALFYNNTLSELNVTGFSIDRQNHKVITDMLSLNRGLKMFHMVDCAFFPSYTFKDRQPSVLCDRTSLTDLWIAALAKNNTLEELTMDLSGIEPEVCSSFLPALVCNTSLKKVNIPTYRQNDVAMICRALRDTGVPESFFVGKHHVSHDTVLELPECKELSHISVSAYCAGNMAPMYTALCLLPSCTHVKSLYLGMNGRMLNGKVSSLIAQYLTDTTALKELQLKFYFGPLRSVDQSERTLLQALSNNKSIRRLSLTDLCINEDECRILVDTLQSSQSLCYLSIYPNNSQVTVALIQMLSPNIESNYMLLDMRTDWYKGLCGGWLSIEDVVRRNNSLVTRAAHFVTGARYHYCAAAAELVQFSPGLVEKVQELASVDENEAVRRIENSLKSFTELDDFMRLAGVVKGSVTCHRCEDGQKQLVDLNRDCWLHLREYLKVGDIVDAK
ncbi:hypothetical protein MTO96_032560 [Rhipicephalus appendiculatus]